MLMIKPVCAHHLRKSGQGPTRNQAGHERAGADRAGSADSYKTNQSADPTNHRELDSGRTFVLELAAARNVESGRRSNYVSLRPTVDGAIAVYAHASKISIALAPERAASVPHELPGAELQLKTPATTYLQVEEQTLQASYAEVLALATEAVDWRATGPKMTAADGRHAVAIKPVEYCPTCHTQLAVNGTGECD